MYRALTVRHLDSITQGSHRSWVNTDIQAQRGKEVHATIVSLKIISNVYLDPTSHLHQINLFKRDTGTNSNSIPRKNICIECRLTRIHSIGNKTDDISFEQWRF